MSHWKPYLRTAFPPPTQADRARLERLAAARLPDRYWRLVCEHQGEVLDGYVALADEGELNFGVLLLACPPEGAGRHASYCIEDCFRSMEDRYPVALLPFADDTGGNYWAFDFRTAPANPPVVFVDHEGLDEDGITLTAENFEAFLAMAGAG